MFSALLAAVDQVSNPFLKYATCPSAWGLLLASIGLYVLVPGGKRPGAWLLRFAWTCLMCGGILGAFDLPRLGNWSAEFAFWIPGAFTLIAAAAMLAARNPIYSALWFALSLLGTAGVFVVQGAQFLGGATIVVYAGAIVVTFLFVLMLAQPEGHSTYDRITWGWFPKPVAVLGAGLLCGVLLTAMQPLKATASSASVVDPHVTARAEGGVHDRRHMAHLGRELFSRHVLSVEIAGTLLMAALVGAVAIAIHGKKPTEASEGAR